ncbi:hypothetical protein SAMN05216388_10911, partial [Halorientalis persicus]
GRFGSWTTEVSRFNSFDLATYTDAI